MYFSNRENECVKTVDGRKVFLSRSCAVIPIIICNVPRDAEDNCAISDGFVLLNKRGPACPDHVGKWTLPCGYLDWDESGSEAAIREIWEECGLDISSTTDGASDIYDGRLLFDIPWDVTTQPKEDPRQNVLLHYSLTFTIHELPRLAHPDEKNDEVSDIGWMPVSEAINTELAFGHHLRIKKYIQEQRESCKHCAQSH